MPAIWRPKYFFDRAHKCYPGRPNSNKRCLDFNSNAPLYYERKQCDIRGGDGGHDILRIQYFLFYGWQNYCAVSNLILLLNNFTLQFCYIYNHYR